MRLYSFFSDFQGSFATQTSNNFLKVSKFCKGMLQAEHQDIHEISHLIPDSEYYSLQHFLSDSPWSSCQLKEQIAQRIDNQLAVDKDRIIY